MPPQSLQLLLSRLCWQMEAPPQSLHFTLTVSADAFAPAVHALALLPAMRALFPPPRLDLFSSRCPHPPRRLLPSMLGGASPMPPLSPEPATGAVRAVPATVAVPRGARAAPRARGAMPRHRKRLQSLSISKSTAGSCRDGGVALGNAAAASGSSLLAAGGSWLAWASMAQARPTPSRMR